MSDPSIREALSAAYDAPDTTEAPSTPAPADATPAAPSVAADATPSPAQDGRSRDDKGRFAPKSGTPAPKAAEATPTEPPKGAAPAATPAPAPAATTPTAPKLRAPQSWRPEVREQFNALPEVVQQEILRREKEASTALQEASGPRKFHAEFNQVLAPYAAMLQAEGSEPLRAVSSLLQTAYALRTASPAHRAALVANIVKTYGVDIEALDKALLGEAPTQPQQPAPPPQWRDPRVDVLIRTAAERQHQALAQEVQAFASSGEAEFFEDVRGDMADLVEAAKMRGVALSLKDAYARACKLHPDVSKVMEQREAAKAAATATAATQQARAAASSVKSQPAISVAGGAPKDVRSTLEAAWDAAAGRT